MTIDAGNRPAASAPEVGRFLNSNYGALGRTVSTRFEPNTSSRFYFWLAEHADARKHIEIGNIIAAISDDALELTFGVVTEMRAYSDVDSAIADYLSHDFGQADVSVPTDVAEVVVITCDVMRNLSSTNRPVWRSKVFFPSELGIQFAYGIVDRDGRSVFSGAAIPIGLFQNGDGTAAAVSIDEDFVLGPEGAHLNVSGISGLASKTSAVEFILKSMLTHSQRRVAVVMFNVKSRDLLYVDQPNPRASEGWSELAYRQLDIAPEPFVGAQFFAPAEPSVPHGTQSLRRLVTERFQWSLQMIYRDIPSLFDQMDWDDKMEGVWFAIRQEIEAGNLMTYEQMLRSLESRLATANQRNQQWLSGGHIATWHKMRSHLERFPRTFRGLITTVGQGSDIPWSSLTSGSVFVVDIQMLNDRGKRLVFGRSVHELSRRLEAGEADVDAVIVFVDELNKFAPSGNVRTPLKARLIDITARGRSIGLVLFGAEQFASDVEKEIVENSATFLFGRTEATELRSPAYAGLSDEVKAKLSLLPQGQLLAKFAKFPQPIFLRFPFPPVLPGDLYEEGEGLDE